MTKKPNKGSAARSTNRFSGVGGKASLIDALRFNKLVLGDAKLADAIAEKGAFKSFDTGDNLVNQNDDEGCVYFVLGGDVAVWVNGRHVGDRASTEVIGEMAGLDPSATRSATVTAKGPVKTWCVQDKRFREILKDFPSIWQNEVKILADRLRERAKFHREPNPSPILFVGSSAEGLAVAKALEKELQHSKVVVRVWTTGVFGPSGIAIDELLEQTERADFAAFVFGPDDKVASRGKKYTAPRDNVVFELGLFMGSLGRKRTFVISRKGDDVKIPSDLLGVNALSYIPKPGSTLAEQIAPVCTDIKDAVNAQGVR